jgi:hypothetical protein
LPSAIYNLILSSFSYLVTILNLVLVVASELGPNITFKSFISKSVDSIVLVNLATHHLLFSFVNIIIPYCLIAVDANTLFAFIKFGVLLYAVFIPSIGLSYPY